MDINQVTRPVVTVHIDGQTVARPFVSFTLTTDSELPYVIPLLAYPMTDTIGKLNSTILVSTVIADASYLLFTGTILNISSQKQRRVLHLADDFFKLNRTWLAVSYRKEKAANILYDVLEKAKISDTKITCPNIEFSRFSTDTIPAHEIIKEIIITLKDYGHTGYRFFFDERNIFHFGTQDNTGKNEGKKYIFKTGINILEHGLCCIKTIALPIRHSQPVEIDGRTVIPNRTMLELSRRSSRIRLWW